MHSGCRGRRSRTWRLRLSPEARPASFSSSTCGRATLSGRSARRADRPLGEDFLTPELVATVAAELVAMAETLEELEAEEAATGA